MKIAILSTYSTIFDSTIDNYIDKIYPHAETSCFMFGSKDVKYNLPEWFDTIQYCDLVIRLKKETSDQLIKFYDFLESIGYTCVKLDEKGEVV